MKISLASITVFSYLLTCMPAHAQITNDSSLPNLTKVTNLGDVFEISDGTKAGINLFHSFYNFSIPENQSVHFINNDSSIQNVISRITGNSSEILGSIEAKGSSSNFNLFLINPKGILFGPNAKLNINGSFVATTSNAVQFSNKGFLETSIPNDPSLLEINPTAFFFNQVRPQSITSQASITVPNGNSIVLLGGDIELNGSGLNALNGRIELGGLAGFGSVGLSMNERILSLSFPGGIQRGDVFLSNGELVDVTDTGRGSIAINAHNIELSGGSQIFAGINPDNVTDTSTPGAIVIDALGKVTLTDSSIIDNSALIRSIGTAGDISIASESIFIEKSAIVTVGAGKGNAGNINIKTQNEFVLSGMYSSDTPSQILSGVSAPGNGDSGNIKINAGSISLLDGAVIFSTVLKRGNGGNISLQADDFISIADSNSLFSTQIRTAVEAGATGNAGNIDISSRSLSLTGGGQLFSAVIGPDGNLPGGQGKAGNINISTLNSVLISGIGENNLLSGIFANIEDGANGLAGDVFISTNLLQISDGAKVKLSNLQGQAGNLTLNVNSLILNNGNIVAETGGDGVSNSANFNLNVSDILRIENESLISARATNKANGGNIKINVPILLAFSPTGFEGSDIIANAQSGSGGSITINAQGIFGLAQRKASPGNQTNDIDASSQFGQSGQVQISTTTDPNQGLVELPLSVIDPNDLVAQNPCQRSSRSEFTRSGRGGLPPSLSQDLIGETTQVNLVEPTSLSVVKPDLKPAVKEASSLPLSFSQIVPAQGWVYNDKGEIVLVAYNSAITGPQRLQATPAGCPVL